MLPPASMAFNNRILNILWYGSLAGHSAVKQVIRQGRERLASGLNVVIYPVRHAPPGTADQA